MISRIEFNTVNGAGEAVKDTDTGIWTINAPEGSERLYGTVQQVRSSIKKRIAAAKDGE